MLTSALLHAGFIPFVVAAITALILRRANIAPRTIWPLAFTAGFLAGQLAITSEAGLGAALYRFIQPHEAVDWLPLIVLLALGVTTVNRFTALTDRWRTFALAATFSLAVPIRLLSGNVRLTQQWSVLEKVVYLVLMAATLRAIWLLLATENEDEPAILRPILLTLVATGTAIVVTLSGAFLTGLSCGAVAATIAGTALSCTLLPNSSGSGATGSASAEREHPSSGIAAAAGVITFTLGSLILLGYFFAYVTITNVALLFLALAATSAPLPRGIRSTQLWQQMALRSLLCLLPLLLAVVSAFAA
jgi:hypothetical protein